MWKPQQNGWKVEEIFQSGANRQRQKIGEKDRVRNLAQDCIICKQKDFYKGKQNKTKKNPRKMEGTKIKEIIHENFHIFKDMYQKTELPSAQHNGWNQTPPQPDSMKF